MGQIVIDGETVPVVVPHEDPDQLLDGHMDFDRAVCAAGIKDFIRPTLFSDQPRPDLAIRGTLPPDARIESSYIRVREATPGVRFRAGISLFREASPN